jgi:putative methionine-R-sulfoxide reductase with GAF domain/Tfp pilus assembly protein PilZ
MEPIGPQTATPNRILKPFPRNRRQTVRHRVHTPAYASLNGSSDDMVLDLSEVLDISERGAAIQTSSPWDIRREINLCLDLSETKTYLHTTGQVVWADRTGRIGVSFPDLSEASRRKLKEWLFLNAMVGAANYAARHGDLGLEPPAPSAARPQPSLGLADESRADYTSTLAALSAVQREVEAQGTNLEPALQLIAERSRAFTRADGSAIALAENRAMVCRASSGNAPPVGAKLEVGSGFSGYCARTGFLQRCDDAENDPRVDRESCRLLGIRSMIAVPIRLGETVIGLLEVFSSKAHAFDDRDGTILQRLADTILAAVNRESRGRSTPTQQTSKSLWSGPSFGSSGSFPFASVLEESEPRTGLSFPRRHLILLLIAAGSIVIVMAYLLTPWMVEKIHPVPPTTAAAAPAQTNPAIKPRTLTPAQPLGLEDVRKRAELGDPYEQVALATRYATAEDMPQNYTMALHWFLKAAEQGHVGAQDTLGAYYWLGHGAPKDVTKAYFWSVLARAAGKDASKVRVAFMTSQLTRAQAQAIQREANEFLKQHPPLINSESSY